MKTAAEHKAEGNTAFAQKNFTEAIEHFTKAIELDPTDPVFYSNRSACHASLASYEAALIDAEKCLELNPNFIKGYSRKALPLYKLNRTEEALKVLDQGLALDPSNEQLLKDKDKMQEPSNEQFDDLLGMLQNPTFQKLFQDNPQLMQQFLQNPQLMKQFLNNPQFAQMFGGAKTQTPHPSSESSKETPTPTAPPQPKTLSPAEEFKKQADQLYKEKKFSDAVSKYEECIGLDEKNMLVRNNKAACLTEMKQFEAAHEVVDQAIEKYKEIDYAEKNPVHLAKLYARKGRIFTLQENLEAAINAYQSSLLEERIPQVESELKELKKLKATKEKEAYLNPELANEHREKGNDYFNKGEFGKALEEYEEASKRNPGDPKIYNNRASCFIKILNYQQSLLEVEKALKIEPNFIKALLRKASIHQFLKEYHKAIDIYQRVLKLEPDNQDAKKGIAATNMQISQSMGDENDEQRMQRAMADPEISAIVADPMIRIALEHMQKNPRNMSEYMKDTNLGPKIMKLIQAGIIRTA